MTRPLPTTSHPGDCAPQWYPHPAPPRHPHPAPPWRRHPAIGRPAGVPPAAPPWLGRPAPVRPGSILLPTSPASRRRRADPPRPPAFTLTELLVTLAVIAALAAAALPLGRFAVNRSRAASCLAKLRAIGTAIESWLQDHHDHLPDLAAGRRSTTEDLPVLDNTLDTCLPSPDAFHCPADPAAFARSGSSYLWNSTQSGRHKLQLSFFGLEGQPQSVPLVSDKEPWHPGGDGVHILYADYHVSNHVEFRAAP